MPSVISYTLNRTNRWRETQVRTQSTDTSSEAEKVQIELIRKAPISKRFALVRSWSQLLIEANRQQIRKDHPNASEEDVGVIFVAGHYGRALADRGRAELTTRRQ